jgi:hypothetical protein
MYIVTMRSLMILIRYMRTIVMMWCTFGKFLRNVHHFFSCQLHRVKVMKNCPSFRFPWRFSNNVPISKKDFFRALLFKEIGTGSPLAICQWYLLESKVIYIWCTGTKIFLRHHESFNPCTPHFFNLLVIRNASMPLFRFLLWCYY